MLVVKKVDTKYFWQQYKKNVQDGKYGSEISTLDVFHVSLCAIDDGFTVDNHIEVHKEKQWYW